MSLSVGARLGHYEGVECGRPRGKPGRNTDR